MYVRGLTGRNAMSFALVPGLYSHAPDLAALDESVMTDTYRSQA